MGNVTVKINSCNSTVTTQYCTGFSSTVHPAIVITDESGLDFDNLILAENPSGNINGINDIFSVTGEVYSEKIWIYLNGLRLSSGDISSISTSSFQLNYAPLSGDVLAVDYITL